MSETETRTQIVLARLAAGIAAVLLVLGLVWYGTSAETYPRIWTDIVDRPGGPMWPGEMLIIAVLLAFIPYLLLRGPFCRIARWWRACDEGVARLSASEIRGRRSRIRSRSCGSTVEYRRTVWRSGGYCLSNSGR
jgi:hypothetical protein